MKRKTTIPSASTACRFFFIFIVSLLFAAGGFCAAQDSGDSLVRLRTLRAEVEAAVSSTEKRPLLDAIIDEYAGSNDEAVQEGLAWAMLERAECEFSKKADGLYARMINRFGDSADADIRRHVAEAKYKRIRWDSEADVRVPALAAVIGEYADDPDPRIREIAEDAALDKARTEEKPAEIIALCDGILAGLAGRTDDEVRGRMTRIMLRKAQAIDDPVLRVRLLDDLISEFKNDIGVDAAHYVNTAFILKAKTVTDKAEKIRALDEAVARNAKQRGASWYFNERLELADTRDEKRAVYDRVLSEYGKYLKPEERAKLMYNRVSHVQPDSEKIRLYRMVVDTFGGDGDDSTDYYVKYAMDALIRLIQDEQEKATLYDALVALCRASSNKYVRGDLARSILNRAEFHGDPDEMTRAADEVIEDFIAGGDYLDKLDFEKAIRLKAAAAKDESIRAACYDAAIARHPSERMVAKLRLDKAENAGDKEEKIRLYDDLIVKHQNSGDDSVQATVVEAMIGKAELVGDVAGKVVIYRRIIEKHKHTDDLIITRHVQKAVEQYERLTGDAASAIRYYDEAIANAEQDHEKAYLLLEKSEHLGTAGKIQVFNGIIEKYRNSRRGEVQRQVMNAMLKKASLMSGKEEKRKLYDQVMFGFPEYDRYMISVLTDEAFWQAFELEQSWFWGVDEKKRRDLIERYLTFYEGRISIYERAKILFEKAKLAESTEEAMRTYDEIITLDENNDNSSVPFRSTRYWGERARSARAELIERQKK